MQKGMSDFAKTHFDKTLYDIMQEWANEYNRKAGRQVATIPRMLDSIALQWCLKNIKDSAKLKMLKEREEFTQSFGEH